MSLRQLPDGRWRYRVYAAGSKDGPREQTTFPLGTTHAEALASYRRAQAKAAARAGLPVRKRLTVVDALQELVRTKAGRLSPGTLQEYDIRIRLHLEPFFKEKLVDRLRASDVEAYQQHRREEEAEPGTINGETMLLRSAVRKAVVWNWIEKDPLPPGAYSALPGATGRVDFFTPDEWRAFVAALPAEAVPTFKALLYSGSRLNEVLHLTWGDVDLPGRKMIFTMRKVGSRLKAQRISRALAEVLEKLPRGLPAARVFTRPDGKPWPDYEVKRLFYRAARTAGTRETLSCHSIRHTFASWLASAGVPLRTIAELLGHSDIKTTFRYAHLSPAHLQEAVEVVESVEKSGLGTPWRHLPTAQEGVTRSIE